MGKSIVSESKTSCLNIIIIVRSQHFQFKLIALSHPIRLSIFLSENPIQLMTSSILLKIS